MIPGGKKTYEETDEETDKKTWDEGVSNDLASRSTGFGSLSRGKHESTVHQLVPISAVQFNCSEAKSSLRAIRTISRACFQFLRKTGWTRRCPRS